MSPARVMGLPFRILHSFVPPAIGRENAPNELTFQAAVIMTGANMEWQQWPHQYNVVASLAPGETMPVHNETDVPPANIDWFGNPIRVRGVISYKDRNGTPRHTGFFRQSNGDLNRFYRFKSDDIDADYEYED